MGMKLAPELLTTDTPGPKRQRRVVSAPSVWHTNVRPMDKHLQVRFTAVVLALLTVAAATLAAINFQKESEFQVPYDGVWWVERDGHLTAQRVDSQGPAQRSGIKAGDELQSIDGYEVRTAAALERQLYRHGVWTRARYQLTRGAISLEPELVLAPADRSLNTGLRLIALFFLGIGLYVLLRRWTAPKSTHFYVFCLVSFIFYSFRYTGKLNDFDWIIYWSNVVAWLLQPALFLHFVLTFPESKQFIRRHRWVQASIYFPGSLLLGLHIVALRKLQASELLRWDLDRLQMLYLAVFFIAAAGVLWHSYRNASTIILRQQMKWVTRGTILAITPFTLFYVIPYLQGALPTMGMKVSVLSLVFLPLTFGYAIFRYRLMDVDLIFKRGMAYTLAAAAIASVYFAMVAVVAELVHLRLPSTGTTGLIAAIVVTALLFDPLKNWIQDRMDKVFYHKQYDYRRTLIAFGRELSSEADLGKMLIAVVDRLSRTLAVDRIAIFLANGEQPSRFELAKSFGIAPTGNLDLSFLSTPRPESGAGHLFFENTHQVPRETPAAQQTIARLDLNYYIPCTSQQGTVAMLGLGKTMDGDFLSSEDVELLETLAGYIGIAIQNAHLVASLEQKASQYERLKEFNENIVESISVGVLAVDLADRIESWNSQMEVMYALPRWQALGRSLSDVFPSAFVEEYYRVRQTPGIHNLYKFRLGTPSGESRVTNIAIAPLVTKKFNVIGRLIIVDDITERIELESQLSQAEKMSSIGLLAAGVAHEVNTPLAVISSYAQMLGKQLQGDEQKTALMEKITRQTFRASEIVNNLLNFSRTQGAELGQVDLNKVIHDTLALLEHQLKVARVTVEPDLLDGLPLIHGNGGKLQQVFLNLFLNAKDAMPGGGRLRVETRNGSGVSVTISDTGMGIAQEHIQRIYDPFFTTKNSTREGQPRGTGLGLSVTYGIIQEHAGKIQVLSRPGEGTTFYLEFPLIRKAVNA
ncbi:MAG TPA: ATP-binding protein [Terriglobales bacterium]|nr:ATP-binding protein [Terriglobales bacterium]